MDWENGAFEMPEKPCMIIFDDGACSVAAYAEPLLERYGFCGAAAVIGYAVQAVVNIAVPISTPLFIIFVSLCDAMARQKNKSEE